MKIIIDIPEDTYYEIQRYGLFLSPSNMKALEKALKKAKRILKTESELKDWKEIKRRS